MSLLDTLVGWGIDRVGFAQNRWLSKAGQARARMPMYLTRDKDNSIYDSLTSYFVDYDDEIMQQLAMTISWVYSDIKLIAQEISAAKISVQKAVGENYEDVNSHPFEILMGNPNGVMSYPYLLQYTVQWLYLTGNAYWYLAPTKARSGNIAEIWPIQADKVTPIPGTKKFIDNFLYQTGPGETVSIDPRYVVHFQLPNPYSLYSGLSPLKAARLSIETDIAISQWQRDTYTTGRGIPHTVVMLDENMSDRDFEVIAQQLRDDFEAERKIAVARGGDLKIATVGLSQRDMELLGSRSYSRDEIDTIFLGVAMHSSNATDAYLRQADIIFKEKIVRPLHVLMAGQITTQLARPFYGQEFIVSFEDIRPKDRALSVQEANTYWQAKTFNEARAELGLPPYDSDWLVSIAGDTLKSFGNLPFTLAKDSGFVSNLISLSITETEVDESALQFEQPAPQFEQQEAFGIGSMWDSDAPERVLNNEVREALKTTFDESVLADLKRWRKVVIKLFRAGKKPEEYNFESTVIPSYIKDDIIKKLPNINNEKDLKKLFNEQKVWVSKAYYKYGSVEEALARAKKIGCEGYHTMTENGETIYMPCKTRKLWIKHEKQIKEEVEYTDKEED